MDIYYAKAALYAYPHIDAIIKDIDEEVLEKALKSMYDTSAPLPQYESIVSLTFNKEMLLEFKSRIEKALSKFEQADLDYFEYKYFKRKPAEYFKDFDSTSRGYFRKQNRLIKKFSIRLEEAGANEEWFKGEGATFIKPYIKQAMDHDEAYLKKYNKKV